MPSQRLHRDRATWVAYLATAGYIWGLYGMGPALLLLRDETGMSRTLASLHSSSMAFGFLIVGAVGALLTQRLGRSRTLDLGMTGSALGVVLLVFGGTPALSIPGALLIGFSGSLVLNTQGAFLSVHHGELGPAAIGEQNAAGGMAGLLAPLSIGFIAATAVNWRLALLVGPVVFIAVSLMRGRQSTDPSTARSAATGRTRLPHAYWWAWGALGLCVGVEFSFVMWAGDVLRAQTGASVALAAGGLTAVAAGIVIARVLIPVLLRRITLDRLFQLALIVPAVVWVPRWLSNATASVLVCMVGSGLGVGLHYPLGIARMVQHSGGHPDLATNRSAFASAIAIGFAPLGLGALADNVGVHTAFIAVPVMLVLAMGTTLMGRER